MRVCVRPQLVGFNAREQVALSDDVVVRLDDELLLGAHTISQIEGLLQVLRRQQRFAEVVIGHSDRFIGLGKVRVDLNRALEEFEDVGVRLTLRQHVLSNRVVLQSLQRWCRSVLKWNIKAMDRLCRLTQPGPDTIDEEIQCPKHFRLLRNLRFGCGYPLASGAVGCFQGQQIFPAYAGDAAGQQDLPVRPLTNLPPDFRRDRRVGLQAHLLERVRTIALRHHVEIGRLCKIDLQRAFQGALEGRIAGRVHEVGQHNLLEVARDRPAQPHPAGQQRSSSDENRCSHRVFSDAAG